MQPPGAVEPERAGNKRQHGDGDDHAVDIAVDDLPVDGGRAEHEGKFADLGQKQAGQERALPGRAHEAQKAGVQRRLEDRHEQP